MALNDAALQDVNLALTADADAAVAATTGLRLMGWAAVEDDGTPAAAKANIKHGATGAGGTVMVPIELAASESKGAWYGPQGLDCETSGLSIDHVAGTISIILFYITTNPGS